MRRLPMLILAIVAQCWATMAQAHALPGTAVLLDFQRTAVAAELEIPLDQLELSFKQPLMDSPMNAAVRKRAALTAYILDHVRPVAPDGRAWRVAVDGMRVTPALDAAPIELRVHLWMTPPAGAPVRKFRFNYSVINHEVMTHTVMVFAHNDWENGVFANEPELLGTIRWVVTGIDVDRAAGSFWRGLFDVVRMGMLHIADGTDHLLFLLALLLPAPLLVQRRRWGEYGGFRYGFTRLAGLVTAFTIGHSVTLIVGAFGNITIPSQPVEVAIALSIFVSALHAWRPLLRGRERWVAAGFGLVHGMAFSQVVSGAGLDGWHKAAAVFGFNFGIEVVQLAIVALTAPWLMILARTGRYTPVRTVGAAFAAVASIGWVLERIMNVSNPVSRTLEGATTAAPLLFVTLALLALLSLALGKRPAPLIPAPALAEGTC